MSEEIKRFTLRLNADLFRQIQKQARENKRAAGKEIEYILEQFYKKGARNAQ